MHLGFWAYALLFATGSIAGLVDAVAGGGGLIALPMLLNLGLPVSFALGTNKLQSSIGTLTAAWHYWRAGLVDLRACRLGATLALAGSVAGALLVQRLPSGSLVRVIPWLLGAILIYALWHPKMGERDGPPRVGLFAFSLVTGLGFGFYDGFFGPGVGSFWTAAFVFFLGQNLARATGHTKVMNAASNLAAVTLFAASGHIVLGAGLCMAAGQILGARLGSGLVIRKGARFVRPVFLTIVTVTLARLAWVAYR